MTIAESHAEAAGASELSNLLESDKVGIYAAKTYLALDGTTDDYADLYALINTTINGDDAEIWFKNGSCYVGSNITIPDNIKFKFLHGGMLKPKSGVTITGSNAKLESGLHQIFDLTLGGAVGGTWDIKEVYPEWFGAFGGTTDDYIPITNAINFAYDTTNRIVKTIKPLYTISNKLELTKGVGASTAVSIRSNNYTQIKAHSTFPINTAMLEVIGGSGDVDYSQYCEGLILDGNSISGAIAFNNRGMGGYRNINCYYRNLSVGFQCSNTDGGNFTEFSVAENCRFLSSVATAFKYYRTSASADAASFHGSGLKNCVINKGSSYAISVVGDCLIYNAPLDFMCFASTATLISNGSIYSIRSNGTIRLEGASITMATGAGGVNHSGIVQSISGPYIAGTFSLNGFKETSGLLEASILNANIESLNPILMSDNTSGTSSMIKRKYQQGSSGITLFGGVGNTQKDANAGAYIYVAGSPSGDDYGGAVEICAYSDDLVSGNANIISFLRRTGVDTVAVSGKFDPTGNFIIGDTWNGNHFIMGGYHIWVDGSGKLRIKSGAPSSDTDGTIVGTQS